MGHTNAQGFGILGYNWGSGRGGKGTWDSLQLGDIHSGEGREGGGVVITFHAQTLTKNFLRNS